MEDAVGELIRKKASTTTDTRIQRNAPILPCVFTRDDIGEFAWKVKEEVMRFVLIAPSVADFHVHGYGPVVGREEEAFFSTAQGINGVLGGHMGEYRGNGRVCQEGDFLRLAS